MLKKIIFIGFIIVISGLSGFTADHYLFPRLMATKFFSKYNFLKKTAENITVINKTEQIYIQEDSSISKITNQATSSIVNIIVQNGLDFRNLTGEIVTSDGIIMTYATENMPAKCKIMLQDGNAYDGELLGVDFWSSLAFFKIEANNLPVVLFGNSDDYAPGEKIISIGNDMAEYQNRFSAGILSSFNQIFNISGESLSTAERLEGVFFSDFSSEKMAIGGPIINYSGQAIGINGSVVKNGKMEYFQIPSNKIKNVLNKVIEKKLDTSPTLGAYYVTINKSYALLNGLKVKQGALIYSKSGQNNLAVISKTPAAKAGLKINDIIVKVGDSEISLLNNFSDLLYKYKKGDIMELTVIRGEKEIKIPVQL